MVGPWFRTPWPLCFPIPRGCSSVFSALARPLVRNPARSHSPLPNLVTHHGLLPASRAFLFSLGCCAALATLPSRSRPLFASLIPCLYPTRAASNPVAQAHWILIHLGTVACALHGSLPSRPLLFGWFVSFWTCLGPFFLAAPPLPPVPVRIPHLVTWVYFSRATRGPSSAPFAPTRSPSACSLCAMRPPAVHCFFFFGGVPQPPLSRCASCRVVSCPCHVCWFFLYPPACMHARQHCTGHRVTAPLGVCLRSPHPRGACTLVVPGQTRGALLPCVTLLSSLSSLPPPPPPVNGLLPALLLLLSCSLGFPLLFPSPGLYLARCHAPLGLRPVLRPVGRLGRPPQVPLRGDSPVLCPGRPPLHQFPDGGAVRPVRLNAHHRHGVSLRESFCTFSRC